MRDTWTGIVKGIFRRFNSVTRTAADTPNDIYAVFCKTGIIPYNLHSVLTQLPLHCVPSPVRHQTILYQKTSHTGRDHPQHTQLPLNHIKECLSGDTSSAIVPLPHVAQTAETALTTVLIKTIEAEGIEKQYKGKTTAEADRRVITKVLASAAQEVIKPNNVKLVK